MTSWSSPRALAVPARKTLRGLQRLHKIDVIPSLSNSARSAKVVIPSAAKAPVVQSVMPMFAALVKKVAILAVVKGVLDVDLIVDSSCEVIGNAQNRSCVGKTGHTPQL